MDAETQVSGFEGSVGDQFWHPFSGSFFRKTSLKPLGLFTPFLLQLNWSWKWPWSVDCSSDLKIYVSEATNQKSEYSVLTMAIRDIWKPYPFWASVSPLWEIIICYQAFVPDPPQNGCGTSSPGRTVFSATMHKLKSPGDRKATIWLHRDKSPISI